MYREKFIEKELILYASFVDVFFLLKFIKEK
jgi:hypothetical protein